MISKEEFIVNIFFSTLWSCEQILKTAATTTLEPLFITGSLLIFATYSVCSVILPSFTTKFVEKAMMASNNYRQISARSSYITFHLLVAYIVLSNFKAKTNSVSYIERPLHF